MARRFTIETDITGKEVSEEYLAKAKTLPIGQWLEICTQPDDANAHGERCKLIARIDLVDRFVFIDAVGKKVAELSQREVAHALQSSTLRLLNNGPLVERALHCISSNLTKTANPETANKGTASTGKTVDQLIA